MGGKPCAKGTSELALAQIRRTPQNDAALQSVRWALESVITAQGSSKSPSNVAATAAATRCINTVTADPRVSAIQVAIVVGSDIDLIAFACNEDGTQMSDRLNDHVFNRLPPCHAIILGEPRRNPEDDFR
jgi:hypothetical protein